MKTTTLLTISTAIIGAMANTLPSQMGVEVVRSEDGNVLVREVVSSHFPSNFTFHCSLMLGSPSP